MSFLDDNCDWYSGLAGDDDSDTEDEIKEEAAATSGDPHTAPASKESETKA